MPRGFWHLLYLVRHLVYREFTGTFGSQSFPLPWPMAQCFRQVISLAAPRYVKKVLLHRTVCTVCTVYLWASSRWSASGHLTVLPHRTTNKICCSSPTPTALQLAHWSDGSEGGRLSGAALYKQKTQAVPRANKIFILQSCCTVHTSHCHRMYFRP